MNPLYAILLDGGFVTKKLTARLAHDPTADDIVAECARAIPSMDRFSTSRKPR